MKNLFIFFSLLISCILLAQKKNVAVEYNVKINDEKDLFSTNADLRRLHERAMSNAHKLNFILQGTISGSKFYNVEVLTTEEGVYSKKPFLNFFQLFR